ncbi:type II secretion system protein [Candidatus Saccharibacteria bacterium]|nr:type II secretion system protein [Candidatus Saccharibacteria bacterium]
MNKQYQQLTKDSDKGFTIIEVVLVLAIAGLIFLMVFIALPALQRGQRDAQRKEDVSRISVQLTNYVASTRGAVPSSADGLGNFVRGYLKGTSSTVAGDDYIDPNGNNYVVRYATAPTEIGQVGYYSKAHCDVNNVEDGVSSSNAARDYALTIKLENQNAPYCLDNKS